MMRVSFSLFGERDTGFVHAVSSHSGSFHLFQLLAYAEETERLTHWKGLMFLPRGLLHCRRRRRWHTHTHTHTHHTLPHIYTHTHNYTHYQIYKNLQNRHSLSPFQMEGLRKEQSQATITQTNTRTGVSTVNIDCFTTHSHRIMLDI